MSDRLIREYYACFNERRFTDAVTLFAAGASIERPPFLSADQSIDAYLHFANMWLRAFPDALLTIRHVEQRNETVCEVDVVVTGTHLDVLDLGALGVFKPSGTKATLRMRELLEIMAERITHSSLSFDMHDLVQQLVTIDYAALKARLANIEQLRGKLDCATTDPAHQRDVTERLGRELDAARLIIRPWFRR